MPITSKLAFAVPHEMVHFLFLKGFIYLFIYSEGKVKGRGGGIDLSAVGSLPKAGPG